VDTYNPQLLSVHLYTITASSSLAYSDSQGTSEHRPGNEWRGPWRAAHKHLIMDKGLGVVHFDAVGENLVAALNQLNVPEGDIQDVLAIVGPLRAGRSHHRVPFFPRGAGQKPGVSLYTRNRLSLYLR